MTMGKFSDWVERGSDLVLLNLLWLGCCLPIVTIGPATTALHYVARKMAAGEPYTVWGGFWGSFRDNWKQAAVLWLLLTVFTGLCCANLYLGARAAGAWVPCAGLWAFWG